MLRNRVRYLMLVIGILIFICWTPYRAKAESTKLSGYVYEFDGSYQTQKGLEKVQVTVRGKEGGEVKVAETDFTGYYELIISAKQDPLIFVYSLDGYNACPKRVVQNDLRNKTLDSIALVRKPKTAEQYKGEELVQLSQAVVEVMLIYRPNEQVMEIASTLANQLHQADKEQMAKAVSLDPSTYYNIERLLQTTTWMKPYFFENYLAIFKMQYQ